jgi:hypothetical protein
VRADSAFYAKTVIAACRRRHVRFSITTRIDAKIRAACESIPDTDWVDIRYPQAIYDEDTGRWIFDAQIAETCYTAFEGTRHRVTARLVVRRIRCNASSHCRSPPEIHSSARTSDERHPPRGERRPPRRHSALAARHPPETTPPQPTSISTHQCVQDPETPRYSGTWRVRVVRR